MKMARTLKANVRSRYLQLPNTTPLLIKYPDDYNSWQENFWGRWKRRYLDKNVILAEGIPPIPHFELSKT